jgi:small subunit ribosomal protein S16
VAAKIKLKRLGKVRNPQYRIVVADARTRRDGRAIEELGIYHPKEEPSLIRLDSERVQYWLSVGAQPTDAVAAILRVTGDWQTFKGLEGADGSLKSKAAKQDKTAKFNELLAQEHGSSSASRASKPVEKKADSAAAQQDEAAASKASTEQPSEPSAGADAAETTTQAPSGESAAEETTS